MSVAVRSASIQVVWFDVSFQACSPAVVLSTAPGKDQLLSSRRPGTSHPTQSKSPLQDTWPLASLSHLESGAERKGEMEDDLDLGRRP